MYLHNHDNFKELIEITAEKEKIKDPSLVEKDYWIMHCLYGLSNIGLNLELKGGTSLSKGYGVIHRFSEDIDIKIEPNEENVGFKVYTGKNHSNNSHRESRKNYFDWLGENLQGKIDGIFDVTRDEGFDDKPKYRSGGIRLRYKTQFNPIKGMKEGVLLEVGFDKTTPYKKKNISSWAFTHGYNTLKKEIIDNRAKDIACYEPKYTFVEKLQAIVTKYNRFKKENSAENLPTNFLRHYYDVYCLLDMTEVKDFIGTEEYEDYKKERFKSQDTVIRNCKGFTLKDEEVRKIFEDNYSKSSALYYKGQVPFGEILSRINEFLDKL